MLKERDEREVPLGSKRQVHWLADAEGFIGREVSLSLL